MKPLTLQTVRASPELQQALQGLLDSYRSPPALQAAHLPQLRRGPWLAAERRGSDRVLCLLLQLHRRPLALLRDQAGTLYQCRVEASRSLFLGTVFACMLICREDGFVLQVLTIESLQGQKRRYSPARTAVMLRQLLSSGSLKMVLPQVSLESLPLKPLSEAPLGPRGLWLTSEHHFFGWRPQPVFDAVWDGGKLLLVKPAKGQLTSLSELLPQASSRILLAELEALSSFSAKILKLALADTGELRVLEVQLLQKEPAPLPSLAQHTHVSIEEFKTALGNLQTAS